MKQNVIILMLIFFIACKEKAIIDKPADSKSLPMLPCKEIKVIGKDLIKRKVMKESINFFLGKNCFINNQGIVRLFISSDKEGNEVWSMYSAIDDRHMWGADVTPFFEIFAGDMVLVYSADFEAENESMSPEQRQKICTCTDQIIGNRVYKRPEKGNRWTNQYQGPNVDNPQGVNRGSTGTDCKRRVVFHDDGSYEVISQDLYY